MYLIYRLMNSTRFGFDAVDVVDIVAAVVLLALWI